MRSLVFAMVVLIGCGSGSGVDGDKRVTTLTAGEWEAVCAHTNDVLGPKRTIDCGNGRTVNAGADDADLAECIGDMAELKETCSLTVAQVETCSEARATMTDAEACAMLFPPECAPIIDLNASCI